MKQVMLLILLIPFLTAYGQKSMPGGVSGALVWEITESIQPDLAKWKSKLENNTDTGLVIRGKIKSINHNPALFFNAGNSPVNSSLNLGNLASFTLFTVCQENDTVSERIIFSLENDSAAEMVLTNQRLAALDVYRYANYNSGIKLFPKIYSYTQNKSDDKAALSRSLQFGRPPRGQHLPAYVYNGIMPEVILFNRVISTAERQKVESYLALKYGISLNQEFPVSYLNSKGEIIWDAEVNAFYSNNIAGIGRDDLSGLNQKISENTETPGVLKIGINGNLKNNSFLIWGDNGKPLRLTEQYGMRKLEREWKISLFNSEDDSLFIETSELAFSEINPLKTGEIYWIMTDRTGTGKFPFRQTEYYQCQISTSIHGLIKSGSLVIDADHSGSDVFTLITAPTFFARNIVQAPSCLSSLSGVVQTEIAGGVPPYEIIIRGISDTRFQVSSKEYGSSHVFGGISQGAYTVQVTDSENKMYTEKIWVSNSHIWENKLRQNYKLTEGESIVLNASDGMPDVNYLYKWTVPDGSCVNSEEITIRQPGDYLLSVTDDNNCNSIVAIRVNKVGKSVFKNLELYPNPVRGWFVMRMSLERTADVNVIITDISGKLVKQTMLKNDQFYLYNDIIHKPGIYFITLVSEFEKETLKLVVK